MEVLIEPWKADLSIPTCTEGSVGLTIGPYGVLQWFGSRMVIKQNPGVKFILVVPLLV